MAFWGVEVKPGEPYIHRPSAGRRLKICQAMLGNYGDAGWNFLECNVGDKGPVKLCALNPSKDLMCHLYLEYEEKENVVLSVSGNSSIHLSGYYIAYPNGDHGHCSDKLAAKSAIQRENQGDEVDGKTHAPPKEPITGEAGSKDDASSKEPMVIKAAVKNNASPKGPIVSEADGRNDASAKGPIVSEADGKKDASPKVPIVSGADDKNDASPKESMVSEVDVKNDVSPKESIVNEADAKNDGSPKEHIAGEADGKNDASPKEPLASEADVKNDNSPKELIVREACFKNDTSSKNDAYPKEPMVGEADDKNDVPLKESMVSEDGNYDDEGLPIRASPAKRRATEKRNSKISRKDHVLIDQNLDMGQLNDKKDSKIIDEGFVFTGATELQDTKKRNEDVEHCGSVHAGKGPINKITPSEGLIVEDLDVGKPKGKIASAGRKVTVKYVCKLMDGQTVSPMEGNNSCNFKLGAGEVIPGLDLGVSGMRIGDKRKLTIPPALGYGEKGEGEIPANSWLIYEVELTKVKRYKEASQVSVTPC
ncbi:hypothetical protein ACP70R_012170 [Stipagrostis hirtigluma subsp. patula]